MNGRSQVFWVLVFLIYCSGCGSGAVDGGCNDECAVNGSTRCAGGELSRCESDDNGCLNWSPTTACDSGSCADGERCAGCSDACSPVDETECAEGQMRTCVLDAEGCSSWSTPVPCATGTCRDEKTCESVKVEIGLFGRASWNYVPLQDDLNLGWQIVASEAELKKYPKSIKVMPNLWTEWFNKTGAPAKWTDIGPAGFLHKRFDLVIVKNSHSGWGHDSEKSHIQTWMSSSPIRSPT